MDAGARRGVIAQTTEYSPALLHLLVLSGPPVIVADGLQYPLPLGIDCHGDCARAAVRAFETELAIDKLQSPLSASWRLGVEDRQKRSIPLHNNLDRYALSSL